MMFAKGLPSETDLPPSARVDAVLSLAVSGPENRITERRESGAFRFRFPRAHGRPPEAMIVNIAGGLAGGDQVAIDVLAKDHAELSITSAAAERIYGSAGGTTHLNNQLVVGTSARLIWLPQETIVQEGAMLERRVEIDLGASSALVFGEMLYFGRRASGEAFTTGALRESWRVRREGRLILADEMRLDGAFSESLTRRISLGAHVAIATLIIVLEIMDDVLDAVRNLIARESEIEAGATAISGLVLVRLMSEDASKLRRAFLRLAEYAASRMKMPLPRALLT